LQALGKICSGDLPPEQSQAVMKELDKHGSGEAMHIGLQQQP
jgi:hypothetical protein